MNDVLNVVKVAPEKPFEFAAPYFGVRVEDPPEDLDDEELFAPNLGTLLSQVMNRTAARMQMEESAICCNFSLIDSSKRQ